MRRRSEEKELKPKVCALRGPGHDTSRDQHALRPPRDLHRAEVRRGAQALGTFPGILYRQFDIPQPHSEREQFWWDEGQFEYPPTGSDRWVQTSAGLVIRTHSKKRRREFHPRHRSCPVDLGELSSQRFTVFFPDNTGGIYVDPRPRFVEQDDWNSGRTWSKDYQWRGFTVFVLKTAFENRGGEQHPMHPMSRSQFENVPPAPRRATMFRQDEMQQDEDEEPATEQDAGRDPQAASSSSFRDRREGVTINVNIVNNSGGTSSVEHGNRTPVVGSATDSDFEFVTP